MLLVLAMPFALKFNQSIFYDSVSLFFFSIHNVFGDSRFSYSLNKRNIQAQNKILCEEGQHYSIRNLIEMWIHKKTFFFLCLSCCRSTQSTEALYSCQQSKWHNNQIKIKFKPNYGHIEDVWIANVKKKKKKKIKCRNLCNEAPSKSLEFYFVFFVRLIRCVYKWMNRSDFIWRKTTITNDFWMKNETVTAIATGERIT